MSIMHLWATAIGGAEVQDADGAEADRHRRVPIMVVGIGEEPCELRWPDRTAWYGRSGYDQKELARFVECVRELWDNVPLLAPADRFRLTLDRRSSNGSSGYRVAVLEGTEDGWQEFNLRILDELVRQLWRASGRGFATQERQGSTH